MRIAMPTEGDTTLSRDRVLLLRFDWPTSGDETQPVLLALPERLD